MRARILAALFACAVLGQAVHAGNDEASLPVPANLQREAAAAQREGKPVVILFSLPGCSFCHVVRQNYLTPLLRGHPAAQRPVILEVDMTGTRAFIGFAGKPTTEQQLAKDLQIRFAPTVVFLDAQGRMLTEPIAGGDTSGMYGGYLDNAFANASKKLSAIRQNNSQGDKP